MLKRFHFPFQFSVIPFSTGIVALLALAYVGLIAVVMSYAALTVSFAQSAKDDESVIASLEAHYLAVIANVENTNYAQEGYVVPSSKTFVLATKVTALR